MATEVIDYDYDNGVAAPATPTAAPRVAQADKLRELKRLSDDGVITAAEHERKREEILRSAW
jgi:hypothetical protein